MNARTFEAVLLDAGNTLFTEVKGRHEIYAEVAAAHGFAAAPDAVRSCMAAVRAALPREIDGAFRYSEAWFRVFNQEVFGALGFAGDVETLTSELFERFREERTFVVFPEVRAVLKRLKGARMKTAVVSNWSPALPRLLGRMHLAKDIDVIVTSAIVRMEKPDVAIFRRAAELLRVDPRRAVHVGDRIDNDVEGARASGMRALLIDRNGRTAHLEVEPDRLASLDDLLPIVGLPRL